MKNLNLSFLLIVFLIPFLNNCLEREFQELSASSHNKRKQTEKDTKASSAINDSNKKMRLDDKSQKELNDQFLRAASDGNLDQMEKLYSNGAQINSLDEVGDTALSLIIWQSNNLINIIKFLISKGIDINAKNIHDESALSVAISKDSRLDLIETLIKQENINLDQLSQNGDTPLTRACFRVIHELLNENREEIKKFRKIIIKLLLQYGANPITPRDYWGKTFFDYVREFPEIGEIYTEYLLSIFPKELCKLVVEYVKEPPAKQPAAILNNLF